LFKQQFCTKNTHRYTHKSCEVEEEDWPQRERVGERAEREQEKTNEHECESELVIAHTRTHGRATLTHGVALYAALLGAQPKEEEDEEELKKPKQRQNAKGVREMEGGERRRRGRAACQFVCQECATQSSIVPLPLPTPLLPSLACPPLSRCPPPTLPAVHTAASAEATFRPLLLLPLAEHVGVRSSVAVVTVVVMKVAPREGITKHLCSLSRLKKI